MTICELRDLQASGEFHHGTYRNAGTLWEGLWIYRRSTTGFRGYDVAGRIDSADEKAASDLIRGIHVGSYGNG